MAGVGVAMHLSDVFICRARNAYVRSVQDRLSGRVLTTGDNNYSENAVDVFVLSVAALEAFINEVAFGPMPGIARRSDIASEMLEDLEIRRKYYLVPRLAWNRTYDRGAQPYQDFDMLVRLRNDLVHFRMKFYSHGQQPTYAKTLSERGLLLPKPANRQVLFFWPADLFTSRAALWAYNTACRMVGGFIDMADDETRELLPSRGENFREIDPDSWRIIVGESA